MLCGNGRWEAGTKAGLQARLLAPPRIWILLSALLISAEAMLAQCSMCRRALVNSVEGQKLARGFNSGILFLLFVPVLIFGSVAFLIHRSRRGDVRA